MLVACHHKSNYRFCIPYNDNDNNNDIKLLSFLQYLLTLTNNNSVVNKDNSNNNNQVCDICNRQQVYILATRNTMEGNPCGQYYIHTLSLPREYTASNCNNTSLKALQIQSSNYDTSYLPILQMSNRHNSQLYDQLFFTPKTTNLTLRVQNTKGAMCYPKSSKKYEKNSQLFKPKRYQH